jgi:PAB-dependent poly(A)-specific ribonuclease subunit 2
MLIISFAYFLLIDLPGKGDLVALDCEFVSVQAEKSHLSSSGAKSIISESRNALARLSVIDCRTNQVMIDDYVLPNEPVVDCLTRFSGVRDIDLDTAKSPHHLVTTRAAYLKVRLLMER